LNVELILAVHHKGAQLICALNRQTGRNEQGNHADYDVPLGVFPEHRRLRELRKLACRAARRQLVGRASVMREEFIWDGRLRLLPRIRKERSASPAVNFAVAKRAAASPPSAANQAYSLGASRRRATRRLGGSQNAKWAVRWVRRCATEPITNEQRPDGNLLPCSSLMEPRTPNCRRRAGHMSAVEPLRMLGRRRQSGRWLYRGSRSQHGSRRHHGDDR
jgi:hypothetical protein